MLSGTLRFANNENQYSPTKELASAFVSVPILAAYAEYETLAGPLVLGWWAEREP
jgi:hypothetical protein